MSKGDDSDPRENRLRGYPVQDGPYHRNDDAVVGVFDTPDEYAAYLIDEGVTEAVATRKSRILGDMAFPLLMVEV